MRAIEDKLKELEALKLAAAKESMGDAATGVCGEHKHSTVFIFASLCVYIYM